MTLIGVSSAACELRQGAELAARSDVRLLVTGERGVGKEFLARVVHQGSRGSAPFVPVCCAALAKAHGKLFGDSRCDGGAAAAFEDADGGTLFLDSIGELTLPLQKCLMRFLDTAEIESVGGRAPRSIDTRIICSTRTPLADAVRAGTFREDLYYRLNVMHLEIPPLRERRSDIDPLLDHFTVQHAKRRRLPLARLTPEWRTTLDTYAWPENVRELKATAERLIAGVEE